jgi:hypothetical protein
MKAKCTANKGNVLPVELFNDKSGYNANTEFQLIIAKGYTIYAITHIKKNVWFLIYDEVATGDYGGIYPKYLPAALFEITDSRLSKYWQGTISKDEYNDDRPVLKIGFKELIEDEYFLGNLWEDSEKEMELFSYYKKAMDNEFI